VLSTIASPAFFKITVFYGDEDFRFIESWNTGRLLVRELSQVERAEEVSRHRRMFEVFREAQKVRDFQLKLHVSVCGSAGEEPVRILEEAIAKERAENGFSNSLYDPFVGYNPQRSRLY
jgi:hypothetical protein